MCPGGAPLWYQKWFNNSNEICVYPNVSCRVLPSKVTKRDGIFFFSFLFFFFSFSVETKSIKGALNVTCLSFAGDENWGQSGRKERKRDTLETTKVGWLTPTWHNKADITDTALFHEPKTRVYNSLFEHKRRPLWKIRIYRWISKD